MQILEVLGGSWVLKVIIVSDSSTATCTVAPLGVLSAPGIT